MKTTVEINNITCVKAICNCIDILISEYSNQEKVDTAKTILQTILRNAMPFMRGEEKAVNEIKQAIISAEEQTKDLPNLPSDIFVEKLSEKFGFTKEEAHIFVTPPFYRALSDAFLKQKQEEKLAKLNAREEACDISSPSDLEPVDDIVETAAIVDEDAEDEAFSEELLKNEILRDGNIGRSLKSRLGNIVNIFCKGETMLNASKQILFTYEVFGINLPEFVSEEKTYEFIQETTDKLDEESPLCREIIEDMAFRIFHKVRLGNIVKYLSSKSSAKNKALLETLSQTYDFENEFDKFIDDPFYLQKKERSVFVKGLQKYTLETLVLTRDFLNEHGLRFYLTEGTLLGAIRHKGFIPWDDDIDIAMPRKDYRKLVQLANEGLIPPELNFDSLETNPKHWVLGAKMQLVRETPYIQHKVTNLSKCNGPYVDVFPLDCWKSPFNFKQRIADKCVKLSRRMLFMKTGYSTATKKKPVRIILKYILPFVSNKWIEKFAIKNMTKFHSRKPKYYVNLCSYYPFYKEVFPASFFGEPKFVEFEGETMPVPCEYDYILKTVYGRNYDTIPPVRVTKMRKHAFELKEETTQN